MAHPGLMVPYVGMIPGGLIPGKKIAIHGMVLGHCNRFSVNLQCGPNVNPRDDISLHMNFRYDQQVPYVVRNSLQMQQWGLEEGHGYLSFGRGHTFEIIIHVEHDHYKIYFNGQHFSEFRYRIPFNRVTYLAIDGEVVIHAIKVDGYDLHSMTGPSLPYGQPGGMPMGHQNSPYGYAPRGVPGMPPPMAHVGPPMTHIYPGYPTANVHPPSAAIPVGAAMVAGSAAMMHGATHMSHSKAAKKQKKAMKKAMKHHKHGKHSHHGMHGYPHHGHHKSSSSSSSSSEEE